jgi:hypothetical protein
MEFIGVVIITCKRPPAGFSYRSDSVFVEPSKGAKPGLTVLRNAKLKKK